MDTLNPKPYVWQMIKEATEQLNGKATYGEIKQYINKKWADVNESTITAQIVVLTVNHKSRVHYPENNKPRVADGQYDLLFSIGRGSVVKYDVNEHGTWEITKNSSGGLEVQQVLSETIELIGGEAEEEATSPQAFALESHLRDFLAKNLGSLVKGKKLSLYQDSNKREGKEYPTSVGFIDILAIDENGNFVIFELKLSRGVDSAVGQIQRYMGWVKKNLAKDKGVSGIIVAQKMDDKIKYAVSVTNDITLYEYALKFDLFKQSVDEYKWEQKTGLEAFRLEVQRLNESFSKEMDETENNREVCYDGAIDTELYFKSPIKIAWLLKEPYDEEDGTGGGWSFSDFFPKENLYASFQKLSSKTWHPITYATYAIFNNFSAFMDIADIANNHQMPEVLRNIAVVNIQKLPSITGKTTVYYNLQVAFDKHKNLLQQQINLLNPDILICGNTMGFYKTVFGLDDKDKIESYPINYWLKDNKIYIDAYHPAQLQVKWDVYVDSIVSAVKKWFQKK